MKRIILLFGLIFSLVAVKANAGETPTNAQKAYSQSIGIQKMVSLTDDQRVKVEAVLLSKMVAIEAINGDLTKDGAAKLEAIEALKQTKDQELAAIMTPDQFALFTAKRAEMKTKKESGGK